MIKKLKFITVKWHDHHESDAAWATAGEEPQPAKFESRGYLIYEDDIIIEITNTIPLDKVAGAGLYGRPLRLIKAAVYFRSDKKPCPATQPNNAQEPIKC